MTITTIRALGALHDHLIDQTAPTAELARRAGELAIDPDKHLMLARITAHRELAGAALWQRVADHLTGHPQAQILVLGAVCAFNAGDYDTLAAIIGRHRACVERGGVSQSALIELFDGLHRASAGANTQL